MRRKSIAQMAKEEAAHSFKNMNLSSQKSQDIKDIEDWNRDRKVKK